MSLLNQFLANLPILCPLKTPESQRFSRVFRIEWYRMETLSRNKNDPLSGYKQKQSEPISVQCCISYRNQSLDMDCKSNYWFP